MKVEALKLNFLDKYYMFYDWLENDELEIVYNLKLYKVSSKIISDFISKKIRLLSLELIQNRTTLLFSDGYTYIALEFNNIGEVVYKSSLLLEDELKISKKIDNLKCSKISYEILEDEPLSLDLRINEEIRKTIHVEINNLVTNQNLDKLHYLYYEWFNKSENDLNKMITNMKKKITMPLGYKEKYIYELIKKSYKLV